MNRILFSCILYIFNIQIYNIKIIYSILNYLLYIFITCLVINYIISGNGKGLDLFC